MLGLPIAFAAPFVLLGLLALPVIWWLLRLMPPRPRAQAFPPTRLLAEITKKEDTPHRSPWWLTALRLLLAAFAIIALSGPLYQPDIGEETASNPLVLIVDNGWSAARDWDRRTETARGILDGAIRNQRPVALVMTSDPENVDVRLQEPEEALERLSAQEPVPYREDRLLAAQRIERAFSGDGNAPSQDLSFIWIASPLSSQIQTKSDANANPDRAFAERLENLGTLIIRHEESAGIAVTNAENNARNLEVTLKRLPEQGPGLTLRALDQDGLSLADLDITFEDESLETRISVELPIELRNEIRRLVVAETGAAILDSAGAVYLVDDRSRRRSVGLVSGVSSDLSQPLLSPLYYLNRALEPFADIREAQTANLAEAIPTLIKSGVSMLVLADVGRLPDSENQRLREFMTRGGTVIRFAGPRLAAAEDDLTPVTLRAGERNLGGSLTWEEPQKLARFSENGPFSGMRLPDDIEVRRQVLAQPDFDLLQKTWAELEDGTPLVTAERNGDGWLVLFHVTADATWSSLPISGAFVEMLTKLVAFSSVPASEADRTAGEERVVYPPYQTLDAFGRMGAPTDTAEPIALAELDNLTASRTAPPGLYGKSASLIAHNLMQSDEAFIALDPAEAAPGATILPLGEATATDLKPLFFTLMMLLLIADAVIVAALAGLFSANVVRRISIANGAIVLACAGALMLALAAPSANAQQTEESDDQLIDATLTTRLAYVVTGDQRIDDTSLAGLRGLTHFLTQRTALEPGEPVGLDLANDELSFFPLLYWPIHEGSEVPDSATMARVDAFMKQGGTVLFDTR
ncbi:MAG: DUF4159 domain-containing protein, partial [Pseudomonadota bacterium]